MQQVKTIHTREVPTGMTYPSGKDMRRLRRAHRNTGK